MSAWQPLPADLPPEVGHFVEQLRLLKDRTGLSLVALGERTAYSKSSWHRYLNATQPPPRQAVVALCRVAGADAERFGVRWELAVRAWPRTVAPAQAPAPAGAPVAGSEGANGATDGGKREDGYEDDPTVPWWDLLAETPEPEPARASWAASHRLLLYALVLVLVLLLTAVVGAVTLA
ncbi:helix-turn-helix transcriptional regulator [Streptomyces sp. IB201691-2A2]|uniref:helix-turn-helix domain-containing protein n=1 Tax=Streptomyces sp. IB201691-2A2 TaxID=2561920 RepID=UPI00117E9652|nr:helix-turn-helix transcriptional regulator [Streptomyces sp. IB201691-2A2]TRO62746.1 XRE family transcriptional regulator [Streptomyces sp. IB201691-2A2]